MNLSSKLLRIILLSCAVFGASFLWPNTSQALDDFGRTAAQMRQ